MPDFEVLSASPWNWAALGSIVVAVIYTVLWPRPKSGSASQVRRPSVHLVLRWGHAAAWVLLAIFFTARGGTLGLPVWLGYCVGVLAAALYVVFLSVLAHDRGRR